MHSLKGMCLSTEAVPLGREPAPRWSKHARGRTDEFLRVASPIGQGTILVSTTTVGESVNGVVFFPPALAT